MKKLFYLSTCSTCKKLMKTWDLPSNIELVDLKMQSLKQNDLEEMYKLTKSYEVLFSKRSQNFAAQGLKDKIKTDSDYGFYLPQDYTFLKRPVLVYDDHIFIGNSPKTAQEVELFLLDLNRKKS